MKTRKSGILLHITSLPSPYGIGDLGNNAYRFVDFLEKSGQRLWQILPINATTSCPYAGYSAFAGNTLLISPDILKREGFIDIIPSPPKTLSVKKTNFKSVINYKEKIFKLAYQKHKETSYLKPQFDNFCRSQSHWLDCYAFFSALLKHFGGQSWSLWPHTIATRQSKAITKYQQLLSDSIHKEKYLQFIFFKQWFALKKYCHQKKIKIIGDISIYVNHNSADVWSNPKLFKIDRKGNSLFVGGAPPDSFSSEGQIWNYPVYNWNNHVKENFSWWKKRWKHNTSLFDIVRLDHFQGLVSYWQIPGGSKTACNGRWVKVPSEKLLLTLSNGSSKFSYPIIAEDLGTISKKTKKIMHDFSIPGMNVLLFAFDADTPSPYLPHNHLPNSVVYPGTHDNNTIIGWYKKDANKTIINRLNKYLGKKTSVDNIHWDLIQLAMKSVAKTVIIQMQDILGLDSKARMNHPLGSRNNWRWRLQTNQLDNKVARKLKKITQSFNRI